ncbi:MAG: phosphoribosylglycinamide formyltransferase [Acetobacter sp.]|nr:phosphoribosylglycinamide formyltransferase [Acetobacter sp.]MBR2124216.1 phosphoribosylglycinamide formyltransferase [Acetobacter sp.]
MSSHKTPVALMISGRGSNASALIHAAAQTEFPARICLVISNNPDAPGLDIAKTAGIPTQVIDHRSFHKDRIAHEHAIHNALMDSGAQIVCLAGYMRLLTAFLTQAWEGRILNIHPSLLPSFKGLHTHERALQAGVRIHGCTVHLVTEIMDEGRILGQAAVPVFPDDSVQSLTDRVLIQEHLLYPQVLQHFLTQQPPFATTPPSLLIA